MPWVIVLDKNSLHCWFLLNEKLVAPTCYLFRREVNNRDHHFYDTIVCDPETKTCDVSSTWFRQSTRISSIQLVFSFRASTMPLPRRFCTVPRIMTLNDEVTVWLMSFIALLTMVIVSFYNVITRLLLLSNSFLMTFVNFPQTNITKSSNVFLSFLSIEHYQHGT